MTHLFDYQLFALAECIENYLPFSEEQNRQLEHLKSCAECYDRFCTYSAIADAASEAAAYSAIYQTEDETAAPETEEFSLRPPEEDSESRN